MDAEFSLIGRIGRAFAGQRAVFRGIGDDCAVVREAGKYCLYSVDAMVDGVHFDRALGGSWRDVGYKAFVRGVSDIAAMGGTPRYFLLALAMPGGVPARAVDGILSGVRQAADAADAVLIGGDVTASPVLAINVVAIGESKKKPLLRSGAKAGDVVFVSGWPGRARAGLDLLRAGTVSGRPGRELARAYFRPSPRIALGLLLAKSGVVSSMIDVSDGLSGDLLHILEESGVGAVIERDALPVAEALRLLFSPVRSADYVLNGGDDYELLFTAPAVHKDTIEGIGVKAGLPVRAIGRITRRKGMFVAAAGRSAALHPSSYEHFRRR